MVLHKAGFKNEKILAGVISELGPHLQQDSM